MRAPGRVNLIGEHTDYAGLPVLPIAIDRAVYVAAARSTVPGLAAISSAFESVVEVAHGEHAAALDGWSRYLAGALGQLPEAAAEHGARIAVASGLPVAGGLSSSSALTVGVLLALDTLWELGLEREVIVERAIVAERAVGVETGGMDQTVIGLARADHALRIDFAPPSRAQVALPGGLRVVVADSGDAAPKGGTARDAYNERVVGMRTATALLSEQLGLEPLFPLRLADVASDEVVEIMVEDLPATLKPTVAAKRGEVPLDAIVRLTAGRWDETRAVPVRAVAQHMLSEAARVVAAQTALEAGDLAGFGTLLDESHDSLRNEMGCSTAKLDRLCKTMRGAGALGARLTGAGFGGYALAACAPEQLDSVLQAAQEAGYSAFEVRAGGCAEVLG